MKAKHKYLGYKLGFCEQLFLEVEDHARCYWLSVVMGPFCTLDLCPSSCSGACSPDRSPETQSQLILVLLSVLFQPRLMRTIGMQCLWEPEEGSKSCTLPMLPVILWVLGIEARRS